jgi:hypothetical protein
MEGGSVMWETSRPFSKLQVQGLQAMQAAEVCEGVTCVVDHS